MNTTSLTRLVVAVLALCIGLAACGSTEQAGETSTAQTNGESTSAAVDELDPRGPDDTIAPFPTGPTRLVAGGVEYHECYSSCSFQWSVAYEDNVQLLFTNEEFELIANEGVLTPAALVRVDASNIDEDSLEEYYPCTECAVAGWASVEFTDERGWFKTVSFDPGEPPAVLAELVEVSNDITTALRTCVSSELITVADDCTAGPAQQLFD